MSKVEIKNKYFFKNKWQMAIYLILFAFLIYMFIFLGSLDYEKEVPDNVQFATDFNLVPEANVFKYVSSQDAKILLSSQDVIMLIGCKNEWVNYYAQMLNNVANSLEIETIYYYDMQSDREDNNWSYEAILEDLKDYVSYNDLGRADLYAPTLVVKKNNQIIYYDDETSFVKGSSTPKDYWTNHKINMKMLEMENALVNYLES